MSYRLSFDAEQDRDDYVYHVWADDPDAAVREARRIDHALDHLASLTFDGLEARIQGWPRPVRVHYIKPFVVYYERQQSVLYVVRLYHHARRPIQR